MGKMWAMFVSIFLMMRVSAAESGVSYTDDFFIFVGLIVFAIMIIGVFAWSWIRGPVNDWKKK